MNQIKPKRVKKNYVDNVLFYEEMKKYIYKCRSAKEQNMIRPRPNDYIGKSILDIAYNLAKSGKFSGYKFKEEMIGDGIENCMSYIHNFDPDKYKNPHAYFTQIIYFAFLRRISVEKKYLYKKYKQIEQFNIETQLTGSGEQITYSDGAFENMSAFIVEYEKKLLEV